MKLNGKIALLIIIMAKKSRGLRLGGASLRSVLAGASRPAGISHISHFEVGNPKLECLAAKLEYPQKVCTRVMSPLLTSQSQMEDKVRSRFQEMR